MNNVIITGGSGLVATELIHLLLADGEYNIYAVSPKPNNLRDRYADCKSVKCISLDELSQFKSVPFTSIIHCAFARNAKGADIVASLDYTKYLLNIVEVLDIDTFVYISSQSVYDVSIPPYWKEDSPLAPASLYALGKYAGELLVENAFKDGKTKFANIRLSSVSENARFLNVFAKNALTGVPINVQGGGQMCSFVDVRDVAAGLKRVVEQAPDMEKLQTVYNLGSGTTRTIRELAMDTKRIVEAEEGMTVEVNITPADIKMEVGMDISLFCNTFDWHPLCSYDDMIRSLIALNKNNLGGVKCPIPSK